MSLPRALRFLSDLGTRAEQSPSERRRVTLSNQCALLAATTFGVFTAISIALRFSLPDVTPWALAFANGAGAVCELLVLGLNARGLATAARYCLVIVATTGNVGAAAIVGAHAVFLYYCFPMALTPFLLFEDHRRVHRGLLAGFCFASFVVIRWLLPPTGWLKVPLVGTGLTLFEAATAGFVCFLLAMIALLFSGETARAEAKAADALARSEELLRNILPASISERLKAAEASERSLADGHADVTVLFADLVGFTELSARLPPADVVGILNEIFSRFDDLAERLGLEKIKTIGDAYMVAGGLPEARADHVVSVARMALAMQEAIDELNREHGRDLKLRIGIHTGAVVAGVIGKRKFIYDLWGDTVNTASRMESTGVAGRIQITREVQVRIGTVFATEPRGRIHVKGKGEMETFFLRSDA